jgi:predicted dehydrogenase/threonine dehydrogenase-like Zn-dependent dehydrogenase
MKKLYINPQGQVVLNEVRDPQLQAIGTIVKTSFALISSGTELAAIKWKRLYSSSIIKQFISSKYLRGKMFEELKKHSIKGLLKLFKIYKEKNILKNFKNPLSDFSPLGYSCSGIVVESNDDFYKPHERVACAGSNHAELIFSPKNLTCKIPENVSLEEAAFSTLGAIALHGIHRANIVAGEFVGVIGTGLIGLITIQLAKASGAQVFAFDLINKRLNMAKKLGADYICNPNYHNSVNLVNKFTNCKLLDTIIICATSKSANILDDAVSLIRDKGKIVMLGAFPISVDRNKIYYKEADLLISRSYGPGRYDPYYEFEGFDYPKELVPWTEQRNMELFLKLLSEKKINVSLLISDIIPAEKANQAYKKLDEDPINTIAILLKFSGEKTVNLIDQYESLDKHVNKKLIIGLIGCGSFAQGTHLPLLLPNKYCKIKAIATRSQKSADICNDKYKPDYVTTNYKKILKDPDIDTVFIYTQHHTHARFAIEALKAGKNVYVEKPMGINYQECLDVHNTVKNTNLNYFIGFNRRYSPLIDNAKKLIIDRMNPIIINYRIASVFIPGSHWVFDPLTGGGPIIGEFCHFIDLILYLINSKPIELFALGGTISHKNTDVYDSCVVMISFQNGSIANLIYTDLNGPNMPKERIEIYSGDSAIIIDDFKKMNTSGFDFGNILLDEQDKGHRNELKTVILTNLGLSKALVNEDDALKAMELVFKTIESIKTNKPIQINF